MSLVFVGTSGWAYPSWKPGFYPAGTTSGDFLRFYAERFSTVEPWNASSIRVLEKLGFAREGLLRSHASRHGERRDVLLYSLLQGDLR